jgi:hypothetical protein
MSRRRIAALLAFAAMIGMASPAFAQDGARGSPPERIDLTIPAPTMSPTDEACSRQREAAIVSGEIVVCGGQTGPDQRITSRRDAQDRYAAATAFRDDPATPNVDGPGIFRGAATVSGICIPGIFNCPKPPALIVDVRALPQAPPGSDADRIARGLAPHGSDVATPSGTPNAQQRAELGLPPPPAAADPRRAPSPEESAAPVEPR